MRPSKLGLLKYCTGSLPAQLKQYKLPQSPAALEGNVAHALAGQQLGDKRPPEYDISNPPEEMRFHVEKYVNYVESVCGNQAVIEEQVACPSVYHSMVGTPDVRWYDEIFNHLHIFDLKYGFRWVEVFECFQLMAYASSQPLYDRMKITLHIIQPRGNHPDGIERTWTLTVAELLTYIAFIASRIQEALTNPICTTGPWCRDCRAVLQCNTANEVLSNAVELCGQVDISDMDPVLLGKQYTILKRCFDMVSKRIDKAEEIGLHMLNKGERIPGVSIGWGRGSVYWKDKPDKIILAGELMGVDLRKEGVKTPLQAVDAGLPKNIVESLSASKSGKRQLRLDNMENINKIFKR